jgi:tRNA pseudouridine38-40 synthase
MGKISGKLRPHRYDATLQGHKLLVRYVGSAFSGWQRQPKKRTVQECLEAAVSKVWGQTIIIQGSGRTDTGVHALGQVVSFNAKRHHTAEVVVRALNANLPEDVRVMSCRLVHPSFHARFQAIGKTYRYLVLNQPIQDPFTCQTHWHVPRPLDLAKMRKAAHCLVGEVDFASFTSNPGYERETTVRTMRRVSIAKTGAVLKFSFVADGFLYRMVRNLVGGLAKVGLGRIRVEDFQQILWARKRADAPNTAPAHGLYLVSVNYARLMKNVEPIQAEPAEVEEE